MSSKWRPGVVQVTQIDNRVDEMSNCRCEELPIDTRRYVSGIIEAVIEAVIWRKVDLLWVGDRMRCIIYKIEQEPIQMAGEARSSRQK